ncbi:hypothetical protein [Nocardia wallacei]|uniref:hypothetical protein n=1 Tax=Nocardia wallacei TaxID=480035 RepID=UPI002456B58B|nr:hypothetical protein [Nocardia wallacei]
MSIPPAARWALERNDRRIVFAGNRSAALFADTGTATVSRHCHPAWKIVLPLHDNPAEIYGTAGGSDPPAALIPPRWPHRSRVENGYVALFLDAHQLPPSRTPIALSLPHKRRLLAALAIGDDLRAAPTSPPSATNSRARTAATPTRTRASPWHSTGSPRRER